ncbi:hypothetical protein ESY86_16230 [Subsaximicrobium wynnwilliamsii]|uniref:Glycine zipper family protein n=1 Tax=Subsaximicrobium wynnwilliamsii TaxID=291179 RepID=A0A5C6ZEH9_9FLAO|nr:hypothetical protein [Subsaximicrobium wynnwilliamsii]TXD81758.1 hypothetical protein ESY87_16725 [Subsaximicrobium wynnwilliamsii]TXD87584.1 hypothetical protein ESY86_16230 [Subsaximicrobium wynnwilliamsii]TXE01257.1 hypothetical protein ESY88_16480 [Subsaximicrobium wynnwilliamsii]
MKTIKQTQKMVAIFLTFVFLIPTVVSCSGENVQSNKVGDDYQKKAAKIFEAVDLVNQNFENLQMSKGTDYEITQELVDQYAVMLGYEAGEFDMVLVEEVVDKYADVLDRGYEQVLDDYALTSFAKITLVQIAEGNWIEDLENNPNYGNLSLTEKEMLSVANAYSQQSMQRLDAGPGIGAFIGLIVGGFICNVWCVLGGAIIGGIIGSSSKNDK